MSTLELRVPSLRSFVRVPSFPETPLVPVKSREELLADLTTNKILSSCAKLALLIIDPTRRPPLPTRKEAVDFLNYLDETCDQRIQTLEQSLK